MPDQRYTYAGCPCRDAFCAGCADATADVNTGMAEVTRLTREAGGEAAAVALSFRRGESLDRRRRR